MKQYFTIAIAVISFTLFALLSHVVVSQKFLATDQALSHLIYAYRSPYVTQLMIGITFLGGTAMLLFSSVLLFLYLVYKKYTNEAFFFLTTFALGFGLSLILKAIVGRVRPDMAPLIHEVFYSFPSGHSMNACIFYALVAYFIYHFARNRKLSLMAAILVSLLILSIGFSRIYLGVHYPSDVLAGFLAGIGWFASCLAVMRLRMSNPSRSKSVAK